MQDKPLDELFASSPLRRFPRRQIVIYEGDPPDNIYFITEGYVKVYNILGSGAQRIIFIYGPGDVFPLTSYLSQAGVVRYFYECVSDTQLRVLPAGELEKKIKDDISTGESLIRYTYGINQQFFQRIDTLAAKEAKRKVVSLLLFLVSKTGTPGDQSQIQIPLTSQDVADMCGLTRETASSQMHKLRNIGVITGFKAISANVPKLEKLREQLDLPESS